jgi:hypothetical protein
MIKKLSDKTTAKIGQSVEVIRSADRFSVGDVTQITSIKDVVINKDGHKIDLSRWKHIIQVSGEWLININNAKSLTLN